MITTHGGRRRRPGLTTRVVDWPEPGPQLEKPE
jgi:hypothetical protein